MKSITDRETSPNLNKTALAIVTIPFRGSSFHANYEHNQATDMPDSLQEHSKEGTVIRQIDVNE